MPSDGVVIGVTLAGDAEHAWLLWDAAEPYKWEHRDAFMAGYRAGRAPAPRNLEMLRMNLTGWGPGQRRQFREALQAGRDRYVAGGQGELCDQLIALTAEIDAEAGQ